MVELILNTLFMINLDSFPYRRFHDFLLRFLVSSKPIIVFHIRIIKRSYECRFRLSFRAEDSTFSFYHVNIK